MQAWAERMFAGGCWAPLSVTTRTTRTTRRSSEPQETDKLLEQNHIKDQEAPADGIQQHFHPIEGDSLDMGLSRYLESLQAVFGWKMMVTLFATQHLSKGFAKEVILQASPYVWKAYHLAAPQAQIMTGVCKLPWGMKPMIGLISDACPIFGYAKAPYMLIAIVSGTSAMACLGFLPFPSLSISDVVVCLFLVHMQISVVDLLSEAKYAEKMQDAPTHGPALMTYVWFGLKAMALVSCLCSGEVLQNYGPQGMFMMAMVPAGLAFLPVSLGFLEERVVSAQELSKLRQNLYQQIDACILCGIMLVSTLLIMYMGIFKPFPEIAFWVGIAVMLVVLASSSVLLSPMIASCNAYNVLASALHINITGATFYFYTDSPEMYPEGPHFSPFFFNTVMTTTGFLFSLAGLYLYQRYMSTWNFRTIAVFTHVFISGFGLMDVMMFARYNRKLGIPDTFFVLGVSVLENTIEQWKHIPQVILYSRLCPRGFEAITYALLAGSANLGQTVAHNIGAEVLQLLNVRPRGVPDEGDQFNNLWVAALLSSLLPLLSVLLTYRLLPGLRQDEAVLAAGTDLTSGSLFRRWTGH